MIRSTNYLAPELAAAAQPVLARVSRVVRRRSHGGVAHAQISALASLERHRTLSLGQLARLESVTPQTMSVIARRLEQEGFICRRTDDADGRAAVVEITQAGRATLRRARRDATTYLQGRIEQLSVRDRARLAAALPVLAKLAGDD